jgi:hypothetical protein
MPLERLMSYLRFDAASTFALVDAIVCDADSNPIRFDGRHIERRYPLGIALYIAKVVRELPEHCAMRDGRKWKKIPFVIFTNALDSVPFRELPEGVHVLSLMSNHYPFLALREIRLHVDEYYDRIQTDYLSLGMLVRFEAGHVQVGPALKKKHSLVESAYYYGEADRRANRRWVTFRRDNEGLRHDVEMFQQLLESDATEKQMHRFFEQHPAVLMDALLGIPLSHRPIFSKPARCTPDYSLAPILGPSEDNTVELLELKGPADATLAQQFHRGFASKVHRAVDQVRDYDRYLRDPVNAKAVVKSFGYIPENSRQAVLIGRSPRGSDHEIFLRRKMEIGVKILTYDDIFEIQAAQIRGPFDIVDLKNDGRVR